MAKFILTLIRTKSDNKLLNLSQKQVFDYLTIRIFEHSNRNWKSMSKKERSDTHKVLESHGTLEECNKLLFEWENMNKYDFMDLNNKVKECKLYRFLPMRTRKRLTKPSNNDEYFQKFQNFLIALGISLTVSVEK